MNLITIIKPDPYHWGPITAALLLSGWIFACPWVIVSPWVLNLSETATRQAVFYAFLLAGMAWLGRPSYKPKSMTA